VTVEGAPDSIAAPDVTADWLLSSAERGNPATAIDAEHVDARAWTIGNHVTVHVDGAAYFARLHQLLSGLDAGDWVYLTCDDAPHARIDHRSSQGGDRGGPGSVLPVGDRAGDGRHRRAAVPDPLLRHQQGRTQRHAASVRGRSARLRVLLLAILTATIFGSLEAIREGWGRWSAVLVTVGLAVSVLPILLRVLPPLHRDAQTQQRHPHYWITVLGLVLYAVIVVLIVAHP
jgi:hypothetical protein